MPKLPAKRRAFLSGYLESGGSIAAGLAEQENPVAVEAQELAAMGDEESDIETAVMLAREPVDKITRQPLRHFDFAREYLVDHNATRAAIRCGYSSQGAGAIGHVILHKPHVQAEIARLKQEAAANAPLKQIDVLQELARIATSDIRAFFDGENRLKALANLPTHAARAVSAMKITTRTIPNADPEGAAEVVTVNELKFWDKLSALKMLAVHTGLVSDGRADTLAADDPARVAARRAMLAELDSLARPAPLVIEMDDDGHPIDPAPLTVRDESKRAR